MKLLQLSLGNFRDMMVSPKMILMMKPNEPSPSERRTWVTIDERGMDGRFVVLDVHESYESLKLHVEVLTRG